MVTVSHMARILKRYKGFVPQYVSHPTTLCAYYHCPDPRDPDDGGRYCPAHAALYLEQALSKETGADVIPIRPESTVGVCE